jgi:hypothetical protein
MNPELEKIFASDLPDIEKLAQAYALIVRQHMDDARNEVELHRAMGDETEAVKTQVKMSTLEYTLGVMTYCHDMITRKKV